MDLGLGYGSASFSCDSCTHSQQLGGWTLSGGAGGIPFLDWVEDSTSDAQEVRFVREQQHVTTQTKVGVGVLSESREGVQHESTEQCRRAEKQFD